MTAFTGYTGNGHVCEDIDECLDVQGNGDCSPVSQCINTVGSRRCSPCPPGTSTPRPGAGLLRNTGWGELRAVVKVGDNREG